MLINKQFIFLLIRRIPRRACASRTLRRSCSPACGVRSASRACLRACCTAGRRVIYDAEHFFDGYRADPVYALETLQAAIRGGAETVRAGVTGWLAPAGDAAALADALNIALSLSLERRAELARAAQEHVRGLYSLPESNQRLLALYERLASAQS